jgi:hypothetical protein
MQDHCRGLELSWAHPTCCARMQTVAHGTSMKVGTGAVSLGARCTQVTVAADDPQRKPSCGGQRKRKRNVTNVSVTVTLTLFRVMLTLDHARLYLSPNR